MQHRVISAALPFGVGLDEVFLPQYLKEQGYQTHAIGKVNIDCGDGCFYCPRISTDWGLFFIPTLNSPVTGAFKTRNDEMSLQLS